MHDEGSLVERMPNLIMHEEVVPWLYQQMTQFLHEDLQVDTHVSDLVEHAFNAPLHDHKTTLEEESEKKEEKQEEVLRIKREKAEKKRKAREEAEAKSKAE